MPAIVRQFGSVAELDSFIEDQNAQARGGYCPNPAGACGADLGARWVDSNHQDWELTMVDLSAGIVGVHDGIHEGGAGYSEFSIDSGKVMG
jgi:hypothetical protein